MNNLLLHKLSRKALFVYAISLLSLIAVTKADPPTLLYVDCQNYTAGSTISPPGTYAPNSTYQTNLNTLFSVLSSHSNNASNGFYNFTAGSGPPDVAYGLFLCRGDVAADACQGCVEYATRDVVKQCPWSKRANIWYDECLLRYSNVSIFAAADTTVWQVLENSQNVTNNGTRFSEVLGEFLAPIFCYSQAHQSCQLVWTGNLFSMFTVHSSLQALKPLSKAWEFILLWPLKRTLSGSGSGSGSLHL